MNGRIFRTVCSSVVLHNPFWKVHFVGDKPEPNCGAGNVITMCNHQSNVDPFVTCTALLPINTSYIAKKVLFSYPLGGWCMWMAGDLPVHFTSAKGGWGTKKGSVGKLMEMCKDRLVHDQGLTVFPEGVRSQTGELLEFKDGMFSLAVEMAETGTRVLVMAIDGAHKLWPRGDWKIDTGDVYVGIGNYIDPKGKTVEQLKDEVRAEMIRIKKTFPCNKKNE